MTDVTPSPTEEYLETADRRNLWPNFTPLHRPADYRLPVFVRGEGCYVWDASGRRHLDGLASLFSVAVGHGRRELAEAGAAQASTLAYFPAWSTAHPPAIELAERIAGLARPELNRVFFTSGGSESVESALKLAYSFHLANGEPGRTKVIAREIAYHGTSLGSLMATGIPELRGDFEPLIMQLGRHVPTTDVYRLPEGADPLAPAEAIEATIVAEGPETVSAVILEPLQNSGGCLVPPPGYFERVREICDRHGVLLISDEVICAWGRLGEYFGHQRYDYLPDIVTTAKALTSGYAPLGAVVASDKVAAPFVEGDALFAHGFTFGGHPVCTAVGLRNLQILEEEGLVDHVRESSDEFRSQLERLYEIPIVGDVRGDGFFFAIELVVDQDTKEPFSGEDRQRLLGELLPGGLAEQGLIARVESRSESPGIVLSPPLISGEQQFEEIHAALAATFTAAMAALGRRDG